MVRRVNSPDWLPVNDSGEIVVNGTWNWGEFVTINGVTIARETLPLTFSQQAISAWQNTQRNSVVVNAAGRLNWIGARIKASTLFWVNGGYFFGREVIVDRQETDMINDQQFRFLNGAKIDIIGIKVYRGCFTVDSRNTSITLVNFKGYEPIHVAKAMTWSGVANSYTITDGTVSTPVGGRLVIEDYNGRGCTQDHGTWVNGLADFVNPVNGTNITSGAHLPFQFAGEGHTRVYSSARFNHALPNGTALQNIITYMADNATGADIPYNLTLKYALTSDASGNSEGEFLTGYRYVPRNAAQIIRPTIRRSISQADDIYTFYHGGYDIIPFASSNNLIGSGQKQFAYTDALDTSVTLSRADALALLGTKFTISGTTITVNQNATYDELYDATKAFKFQGTTTAFETPTLDSLIVTPNGTNLEAFTGWSLVVNTGVTLSSGVKFDKVKFNTITLTGTAQITGIYQDSTGTSTVLEISGFDAGSAVYVEDNLEVQKFYSASTSGTVTVYIPPTGTGSWYYAVEKYGNQRQSDFFTFSGGLKQIVVKAIPDVGLTQSNVTTVAAYTALENPDKIYDYVAYLRTTTPHISYGQILFKDGTSLYLADASMLVDQSFGSVASFNYDTKLLTIKSLVLETGVSYTKIVADPPATITANTNEIITILIEDANGDSKLNILGGDNLGYELWKVTTATATDDYTTGTLLTTLPNNLTGFRFIGISGFDIVGRDVSSGVRRRSSMLKGTYTQAFYVGDQIQLATNAPQLEENNQKLDELILKTDTNLDVKVSSRLATMDYVAPDNTKIDQIKTKVDTLENYDDTILQGKVDAIQTKVNTLENTDLTGIALEATSQEILTTVQDIDVDFTPVLDAIDLTLKTSQYTAPDNVKIGQIKIKVDTLENTNISTLATTVQLEAAKDEILANSSGATPEEIADQVWLEQPDRLKNVSTVQITGEQLKTYIDN
jgi:hypothetical protein